MTDFQTFYRQNRTAIAEGLGGWLSRRRSENPLVQRGRERLYGMNRGGKCLRGTLACLGYLLAGGQTVSDAYALAEGWELFQTAILVHDDIIDHAALRRGMETIHSRYRRELTPVSAVSPETDAAADAANSIALCLGDLGLYLSQQRMIEGYRNHPGLGNVLGYFNDTILRTIEGETLDVELSYLERNGMGFDGETVERNVYDIYHLKTACYTVIGPLCSGMLLAGAPAETLRQAGHMADALGLAFQMQDDVLGVFGDEAILGKDVGSDIAEYKQTLLYAYVKRRGGPDWETLRRYYGRSDLTAAELEAVRELFRASGALDHAQRRIFELFSDAARKLDALDGVTEEGKTLFRGLMDYLRAREF